MDRLRWSSFIKYIINTITAKELRDNLGDIVKRVSRGEHIQVTYRNQLTMKLEPVPEHKSAKEPMRGLDRVLRELKAVDVPERHKTGNIKQLYRQDMAKKYDIKE